MIYTDSIDNVDVELDHVINGYDVKYNGFWGKWQVSHDEIGACIAEFHTFDDAREYCEKG